jgi:hypothetical protein
MARLNHAAGIGCFEVVELQKSVKILPGWQINLGFIITRSLDPNSHMASVQRAAH